MAVGARKNQIAVAVRDILQELMGDDYMMQIAKRQMLCKDDKLVRSIESIENLIHDKILGDD